MNVLINGSPTAIGRAVVDQLADSGHKLRLTSMAPYDEQDVVVCSLEHDEATDELVAGIDAIINVGYQDEVEMPVSFHLDYYTRRTYNLFWAAANAGVKRVINLSTLRLMEEYEENLVVTEQWRSKPVANDINLMCAHLVEIICKEYARDRKFEVVNLRLGSPLIEGGPDAIGDGSGDAALCSQDLGRGRARGIGIRGRTVARHSHSIESDEPALHDGESGRNARVLARTPYSEEYYR